MWCSEGRLPTQQLKKAKPPLSQDSSLPLPRLPGWGRKEPAIFSLPTVAFPVSAGAPTALQLFSSFHTFGDSTNVYWEPTMCQERGGLRRVMVAKTDTISYPVEHVTCLAVNRQTMYPYSMLPPLCLPAGSSDASWFPAPESEKVVLLAKPQLEVGQRHRQRGTGKCRDGQSPVSQIKQGPDKRCYLLVFPGLSVLLFCSNELMQCGTLDWTQE